MQKRLLVVHLIPNSVLSCAPWSLAVETRLVKLLLFAAFYSL